tara:strand:- start:1456 stop:1911 length:456 start_codon:yes stop_codon:yes gene_type:complete
MTVEANMTVLTIGEIAKQSGIGVETVRYYERKGLLPEPPRRPSGYRQYPPETIDQIRFILRSKQLGFTLKEIKGLLNLRLDSTATRSDVREQAHAKVADIEERILDLQHMRDSLKALIEQCHGDGVARGCPIIKAMQGNTISDIKNDNPNE